MVSKKKTTTRKTKGIPLVKKINNKKYYLFTRGGRGVAFTNKKAAETTAKALRKHPRVGGVQIQARLVKGRKVYLLYVRIK